MNFPVAPLTASPAPADLADLHALLRDAVECGASVGFVLPLAEAVVAAYWSGVLAEIAAGKRLLFAIRASGRLVGSVQLELAQRPNSLHRCELQKLLVLRARRGHGLGSALMQAAENSARALNRRLVVLDTSANGNALGLYTRCGYSRAGGIPNYAADPDGSLHANVIFYKELAP